MFTKIIEDFYSSLGESIKERKRKLNLYRHEILKIPERVSEIMSGKYDKHHPYLISKNECAYLYYLYLHENAESYKKENVLWYEVDDHIKKNGDNYDKMLWGHIDWDKMFKDVVTVLSKLDSSESLGKLFDDTLIDYVPYAIIKYDDLHPKYGREYIFPEERGKERENAIRWVYLRHGSELFKQTFLEKFSGKSLEKFNKHFNEFIKEYLEKMKPSQYSLGLQAYNLHKNISGFASYWQSLAEVQYSDMYTKKSDLEKQLEEYLANGRLQIQKYKKYQKDFDSFGIDMSFNN